MLCRLALLGGFWWLCAALPATATDSAAPAAKFADARELLQRFSIEESHLATLVNGRSLSAAELPLLMRLLLRVGTIPQAELERLPGRISISMRCGRTHWPGEAKSIAWSGRS
jgi:hypothetical protein